LIIENLKDFLGQSVYIEKIIDLPGVMSSTQSPWAKTVKQRAIKPLKHSVKMNIAKFFTDASILTPALGNPPTVILGPGDIDMAHKTDEYCRLDALHDSVKIYEALIKDWCEDQHY
jgi:succinyl-diaminopimelate desuccinylase